MFGRPGAAEHRHARAAEGGRAGAGARPHVAERVGGRGTGRRRPPTRPRRRNVRRSIG